MKKNLLIVAAAVFVFASCLKETTVNNGIDHMNEIALRSVTSLTKSAIDSTTFPAGYDMLVSAYRNLAPSISGDDVAGDYFEGIHFTKVTDKKVWKEGKYWPPTGTLDFLCIASAGLNSENNGISPVCTWGADNNVARKLSAVVPDNSSRFDDLLFGAANAQSFVSEGNAVAFRHAMTAVVFTAKSNLAYDKDRNVGITIDSISVNGAKYSGKLTVLNPAAGGASGDLSASWSDLGDAKAYVYARVWDSTGAGIKADEPVLTGFNLSASSTQLSSCPFGDGYVILPEQAAVPFSVTYTIHNGFKSDGKTKLDNRLRYKYTPASAKWEMGKKYVYDINISLNEITVAPSVVNWSGQEGVNVPVTL